MATTDLKIFSGKANRGLSSQICEYLGVPLGDITLGNFPDGETSCKINEDVRGRDVFLIQPTCPPVNDNLFQLLVMIDSCKRASAERITAVIPYFGYARQDRKDEGRVPITAKLVANLITRAGADRVIDQYVASYIKTGDANDILYALEASRDYDPGPGLEKITAPLVAINFADDIINPPELQILETEIKRVPNGRAIVVPASEHTSGHGTHTQAAVWKDYLIELMKKTER